jgi:hypothetical protein
MNRISLHINRAISKRTALVFNLLRLRTMYLLTLLSPMSMPSLSCSPWIRGAPQEEFSRHILRIRSRTSREITGRPGWPCRTFQVQKRRKPLRCQAMTVSGSTMASAERQSLQTRDSQTHNRRSNGRFTPECRRKSPYDSNFPTKK